MGELMPSMSTMGVGGGDGGGGSPDGGGGGDSAPSGDGGGHEQSTDNATGGVGSPSNQHSNAGPGPSDTPATEGEATGAAPATTAEMFKVMRGGQEVEMTHEQLLAAVSDDHEHTIKANGADHRMRYPDLVRNAQLGLGAMSKMQEAAQLRKQYEERIESGKSDPIRHLEEHILDGGKYNSASDWMMDHLRSRFEEDKRLSALQTTDPHAYRKAIEDRTREQMTRRQEADQSRAQQAQQQQQQQQERQRFMESIPQALEAAGLPHNPSTHAHLGRIMSQYRDVGHDLSVQDAAAIAKEQYYGEIRGHISKLTPEQMASVLGDDTRKALRAYELAKVAPKKAPAASQTSQEPRPGGGKPRKPVRLRDVLKG